MTALCFTLVFAVMCFKIENGRCSRAVRVERIKHDVLIVRMFNHCVPEVDRSNVTHPFSSSFTRSYIPGLSAVNG